MVRLRGIKVNAIAQLDIHPLIEHTTASAFDKKDHIAECYLLIQPGSQLWFEYSVDGPHPEKAIYFFKLLFEGRVITSWDCTEKHGYHGKVAYSLHTTRTAITGNHAIFQHAFRFSTMDDRKFPGLSDDCIEIRVYRVQHRRRLRDLPLDCPIPTLNDDRKAFRLIENGLIEDYRPARKYQYQLLDAKDTPFATFRFYCRTKCFLSKHKLLYHQRSSLLTSTTISDSESFDADSSPVRIHRDFSQETRFEEIIEHEEEQETSISKIQYRESHILVTTDVNNTNPVFTPNIYLPRSTSTSSVASKVKGSVEDLPSLVPRLIHEKTPAQGQVSDVAPSSPSPSPDLLPRLRYLSPAHPDHEPQHPPILRTDESDSTHLLNHHSPIRQSYQRHKRHRPNLTIKYDEKNSCTSDDVENGTSKRFRPLSPFTNGGFLRRLVSSPEPMRKSGNVMTGGGPSRLKKVRYSSDTYVHKYGVGNGGDTDKNNIRVSGDMFSFRTFLAKKFERRCTT